MKLGRVVIDERGISQKRFLLVLGEAFSLAWPEVTRWAVTDSVIYDAATGTERVDSRVLELHARGTVHFITRAGSDAGFRQIVDAVRHRLPDKERESLLAAASALRQGGAPDRKGDGGA